MDNFPLTYVLIFDDAVLDNLNQVAKRSYVATSRAGGTTKVGSGGRGLLTNESEGIFATKEI